MYEDIKETLKKTLSKRRYTHILGVADEARRLSKLYGASEEKAYLAGLLHDCAKEIDPTTQLRMCEELNIYLDDIIRQNPKLIHGPLGAEVAKRDFGIHDEEILGAIRWHTVGKAGMTLLEKIIYIADLTEVNRDFDDVDEFRKAVNTDIDEAILLSIRKQLAKFIQNKQTIHPNTVHMWNDLIRS